MGQGEVRSGVLVQVAQSVTLSDTIIWLPFYTFVCDNLPILFQYTVSLKHSINLNALEKLEGIVGNPSDSG